ncbi:MAG: ABC transporter permease [Lautropia sp.]
MSAVGGTLASKLEYRAPLALAIGVLALFIVVFVLAPLIAVLYRAVIAHDPQQGWHLTFAYIAKVVTDDLYWEALGNTLLVAGGAAALATFVGAMFGWIFARTGTPGRSVLESISQLPIFIPPFVGAVSWALLSAPRSGILNKLAAGAGLPELFDAYTRIGMVFVIGIYLVPYVMMIVAASLRSMDPSLEEAAQVSGLSVWQTARRVTMPLLAPSILSGAVLAFTIAIGLFGTPVVLGWSRQILMLTSRIWISSQETPPDYGVMAVLAIYLLFLSSMAAAIQVRMLRGRAYTTVTGKGFRPRLVEIGAWRWVTFALAVLYLILTIAAPIGVLFAAAMSKYTWSGSYSFATMIEYLTSDDVWFTMKNSIGISVAAATIACCLGILVAWTVIRTRVRGRQMLEFLVLLPISVPGIAFGVGLMLVWVNLPVPVYGTSLIIAIAFIGRFTAYAVRSVSASLVQIHPELEESARICGFGAMRTFLRITFPLVLPSVVAAWLLLFSFFMTELSMVVILYTSENRTFSLLAFEAWNVGDFSRLAAYSLLQLAVGLLFLLLVNTMFRNRSVQRKPRLLSPN